MSMTQSDRRIQQLTEEFVSELSILIREGALEAVRDTLEGGARPAKARAGRKPTGRKPGRPPGSGKGKKRIRRSTESVDTVAADILGRVKSTPGLGASALAEDMGVTTKDLRLPLLKLLGDKQVRTEGRARGTKYFAGAPRGAKRKKKTRSKK